VSLVNVNIAGGQSTGALVGILATGTVQTSYSSGSVANSFVTGGSFNALGGLVGVIGSTTTTATVTNSYSTANVTTSTGSQSVGGLVGYILGGSAATISYSYSSGTVTAPSGDNVGGFLGLKGAGTLTNNFWDTTTNPTIANAYSGSGGITVANNITGVTTANLMSFSTFSTAWGTTVSGANAISKTTSTGATAPTGFVWLILDNGTMPILEMEYNTNISTPHQLQLVSFASGQSYNVINNINLSGTTNASDVWGTTVASGAGFVPIANYSGIFNGGNFIINNLYINSSASNVGYLPMLPAIALSSKTLASLMKP